MVPPSAPQILSLSPVFSFFKSLLSFFLSAVTALIQTTPHNPLFHHSLSNPPCDTSSPGVSLLLPPHLCPDVLSKIQAYARHPPANKCSSRSHCFKKNTRTRSNSVALPVDLGSASAFFPSSHPSHLNPAAKRHPELQTWPGSCLSLSLPLPS